MEELRRAHIYVSGRVQGVFFRATVESIAKQFRLKGYVKNLPDGRVEIVAEGEKQALEHLINWARRGTRLAKIEEVEATWQEPTGEFGDFHISYWLKLKVWAALF